VGNQDRSDTDGATSAQGSMRLFVTGGTGVLGKAFAPIATARGHRLEMPGHSDLDLFSPEKVVDAIRGCDAVLHLATRIQSADRISHQEDWRENDVLRTDASRILVDAARAVGAETYIQPTVTFVYPAHGPVSEDTPVTDVLPILRSALSAEQQAARFAQLGGRGVVLRFGFLDGPGTGNSKPNDYFGATLHVADAGTALLLALTLPSGIYNVCRDGERVSNTRFVRSTGWHPQH
jgi:nucleoside-diphosphate-sugar epimerase